MSSTLKKEFEWYLENQAELVKKYDGKVLVIKDQNVFGAYDDEFTAYMTAKDELELGTFLIKRCKPGKESYTATYHSRIAFV